jgi:two-component system response regulator AtoC
VKPTILIIDDEPSIVRSLERVLGERDCRVVTAGSAARGMALLAEVRPHVVLLDHHLPDGEGLSLIREILLFDPAIQVIVITAFGDLKLGIEAMKSGAADFLKKPYEIDELLLAVDTAARTFESQVRLDIYRRREQEMFHGQSIIGESPPMVRLLDIVERVSASNATTVLILGESGTGKELVARAVHYGSERRNAPLMEVNCSAFQETLLENELFGHEKGAFTDAREMKKGLVELCDGGTLFLDEVADMPMSTQAKLLRFLENQTFKRVGGAVDIRVDLRIVAATNKDLAAEIAAGNFREDLYYRLKVVSLELPALRDRGEDVLLLSRWYLRHFNQKFKKAFREIAPEAARLLTAYDWPGNVRELKNVLELLVLLENDTILREEHLPGELRRVSRRPLPSALTVDEARLDVPTLAMVEDSHIQHVLQLTGGNKSQAARLLGISRQGLFERLKRGTESDAAGLIERTVK